MIQFPLISVALCTYNGQDYIKDQIQSIINQSYKNLEIVVCDDCSNDETVSYIKDFMKIDDRIKLFQNEENLGFNKNFEKAILIAKGDLISISDQDDIWLENKIMRLYQNIGNNLLIFSNSLLIDVKGNSLQSRLLNEFTINNSSSYKSYLLHNYTTGHTCLFKRDFLSYILPIPKIGLYDWWMGFIALYHNKTIYLDEVLTHYRVHPSSVIQNYFPSDKFAKRKSVNDIQLTQLKLFSSYSFLKRNDKSFMESLINGLLIRKKRFSLKLFCIILLNFDNLFPLRENKSFLSKLNFARKYSGKS